MAAAGCQTRRMSDIYGHGHHQGVVVNHADRSIADSAQYFEPYLVPGMRLLDVGCGPGSITVEMAERIGDGVVVAFDAEPGVIDHAIGLARDRNVTNVEFMVANAYAMPYPDDAFDAAHAHQVLQHVADPVRVIEEMRRVVRPGGVVAARDADYGTMVHTPEQGGMVAWRELYSVVARRIGAEPNGGRMLSQWFPAAGLADVRLSSSTWTFATPDRRRWWANNWRNRLLNARLGQLAQEFGLATKDEIEWMAEAWDRWADEPTGYFTFVHGEAIGIVV